MIATISGRMKAAPQGGGTPLRGLTHSSDLSREGLAVNATRICAIDGCDRPQYVSTSTLCSMHYQRQRKHGTTDSRTSLGLPVRERFMRFVRESGTDCWVWTGRIDKGGYGYFGQSVDGKWKQRRAHRVAYELFVGAIPAGLQIDHLCRNRACVNPNHLEPVTPEVNTMRGVGPSAQNARRLICERGHPLSGENLQLIRAGGRVKRRCKTCAREARRARRAIAGGAA